MMKKFLNEEKGQGAIEYILLAGGMIVAAIVVFTIYSRMTKSAGEKLESSTGQATGEMNNIILQKMKNMSV